MTNIEQSICDAIEVITNNAISKAGFDRTIQATIVACMNEATGKYKIKYQPYQRNINNFSNYSQNI